MSLRFALVFIFVIFGGFVFFSFLNRVFWKKPLKQVIYFTLVFHVLYELAFVFLRTLDNKIVDGLVRILNYYLGFLLYGVIAGLLFWSVYGVLLLFHKRKYLKFLSSHHLAYLVFTFFLFVIILSIYNFEKAISVEQYTIENSKVTKEYKFVQFNDVQYGSVNKDYLEKAVRLVAGQKPDFAVFVGDLVDFEHYKLEDFNVFKELDFPVYFERGNHEFYHDPERILSYIQQTQPIQTLINQKVEFGEIEIVGIDHNSNQYQLRDRLAEMELDKSKFNLLIYHEPKGVEDAIEKGFDLMLFAHTHGGQIWPITQLIDYIYKYGDGYFQLDDAAIYTSDGVALWGPKMRLDSQNEIVIFNIIPKK